MKDKKKLLKSHRNEEKKLNIMMENYSQKYETVLIPEMLEDALKDFKFEKYAFIYGKMDEGLGHYKRADGYDRVELGDRISRLNGKYAFMAQNIKL